MDKLKLSELIDLESRLHRERVAEELQSLCSYREAQPNLDKEFDFDTAKAYLSRRGYTNLEIDNALGNFAKNELAIRKEDGLVKLEDAVKILTINDNKSKGIYRQILKTRRFMLKHIKGTGIELKFPSIIDSTEANVRVKGWYRFVSIDVDCSDQDYSYSLDFKSRFVKIIERKSGRSDVFLFPDYEPIDGYKQRIMNDFCQKIRIHDCMNPNEFKIYEHIIRLKEETERDLRKLANEKGELPSRQ